MGAQNRILERILQWCARWSYLRKVSWKMGNSGGDEKIEDRGWAGAGRRRGSRGGSRFGRGLVGQRSSKSKTYEIGFCVGDCDVFYLIGIKQNFGGWEKRAWPQGDWFGWM